ncbi:hypothetical protein FK498_01185 [Elioraea sp. Yellowstone]|jgi:hypothetical protein|uniref:hypothetical protein n=1 Tax=Elioraea sp. Yellowstone TaxID=2592070 RepID=UPI001151F934|nr:hypothetical protein [Elioraea sp. Yellowstone]TQF84827.1 hypothetical protein FK498_01185 [Elioraea sp. Yellowstone]
MRAFLLLALAAFGAVGAQANPFLRQGIMLEEVPFAPSRPDEAPGLAPAPPPAAAEPEAAVDGVRLSPGATLAPSLLDPGRIDRGLDGPTGGADGPIGRRLLDAGPGIMLQQRF